MKLFSSCHLARESIDLSAKKLRAKKSQICDVNKPLKMVSVNTQK